MLALHFKQLQKKKNSTRDQKCFSVLTGSHEAEKTGEVTVKPVSPRRAGQASNQTKLLHMDFSHTHTWEHLKKGDTSFARMQLFSHITAVFTSRLLRGHR